MPDRKANLSNSTQSPSQKPGLLLFVDVALCVFFLAYSDKVIRVISEKLCYIVMLYFYYRVQTDSPDKNAEKRRILVLYW